MVVSTGPQEQSVVMVHSLTSIVDVWDENNAECCLVERKKKNWKQNFDVLS